MLNNNSDIVWSVACGTASTRKLCCITSWLLCRRIFPQMIPLDMLPQQRLYLLKSYLNVFSSFCTSQNNLAGSENQQAYFWLVEMVDQARECFWVEVAESPMIAMVELFKFYLEADWATGDHVLDFEFGEFDGVADLADGAGVLLRRLMTIHLTLSTSNDHLTILKNKCGRPCWFFQSHNKSGKSLRIVLGIPTMITYLE